MNSLELVRKLYEGDTDFAALEKELDRGAMEELRQLIEAKEALEALPRQKPSQSLVDAVVAKAVQKEHRRSPLTVILTNRPLQRMAAAAVVVIAVGVGYLALRTDGVIPLEFAGEPTFSDEAVSPDGKRRMLGGDETEEIADAPAASMELRYRAEAKAQAAPDIAGEVDELAARDDFDQAGTGAKPESSLQETVDDRFALRNNEATFADSSLSEEAAESSDLLSWDQEEEALRTFFWQVKALDERSPGEDWGEAVPLEGSFELLEKQNPGADRWLQTGSER